MKIVGHRGARGLAPENTLASINKAIEHHVDMIEFDLRVTKDKFVVLHHDVDIKDASGTSLIIRDHQFSQLKKHKPDLTTFQEALKATPDTALDIEVKPDAQIEPIVKIIKMSNRKDLILSSKSQALLIQLHKALPDIPKMVIEPWSGYRAQRHARQLNTNLVAMNQLWLWWGFIKPVSHRGWELYAYTLNDPKKAKRWAKYGITGIITDYPNQFDKL